MNTETSENMRPSRGLEVNIHMLNILCRPWAGPISSEIAYSILVFEFYLGAIEPSGIRMDHLVRVSSSFNSYCIKGCTQLNPRSIV